MTLILPYPPSVNTYWRHIRQTGRVLISRKGREYRQAVKMACLKQGSRSALQGELAVYIDAFMPDRRKRDLDNLPKAVLDALAHAGVYEDDSQIGLLTVFRCSVAPPGRLEVVITHLNRESTD